MFWLLKKGIKTFNFRPNEPSCDILGPLGRYDFPRVKKQKEIEAWNFYSGVLRYAEFDGAIFVKVLWLLEGVSPIFYN